MDPGGKSNLYELPARVSSAAQPGIQGHQHHVAEPNKDALRPLPSHRLGLGGWESDSPDDLAAYSLERSVADMATIMRDCGTERVAIEGRFARRAPNARVPSGLSG